jgi:hypothetical protein
MVGESEIGGALFNAAVVVGALGALRRAVDIPDRFTPLLSIATGIGLASLGKVAELEALQDATWGFVLMAGFMSGLTASGLWSGFKSTVGK